MNSKLLEQARETAERQLVLADDIEKAERFLELAKEGKITFFVKNYGNVYLEDTVEPDAEQVVRDLGLTAIMNYRDNRVRELEQLLGIQKPVPVIPTLAKGTILAIGEGKTLPCLLLPDTPEVVFPGERNPATINPEFEAATKDMFESVKKQPDPVEEKLAGILQEGTQRIEDKPVESEQSLGKYPPRKNKAKLSDDLLPEIRRMYLDENKPAKEIAEYYKVETKYVSTFIAKHKLSRRTYDKSIPGHGKPDVKQPEETERP